MEEFLQHPAVKGAIGGLVVAVAVDIQAFRSFKNAQEFASYSWGVAAFRAVQGIVLGALSAYGLS